MMMQDDLDDDCNVQERQGLGSAGSPPQECKEDQGCLLGRDKKQQQQSTLIDDEEEDEQGGSEEVDEWQHEDGEQQRRWRKARFIGETVIMVPAGSVGFLLLFVVARSNWWKNIGYCWFLGIQPLLTSLRRSRVYPIYIDDDLLWFQLSRYITWTRLVTSKYKLFVTRVSRRIKFIIIVIMCLSAVLFLSGARSKIWLSFSWLILSHELEKQQGFTAHITSCYDGDTCRLTDLRFDGYALPDLFQKLNVRVLGIDAPEFGGRAKCDLERCLALLAKETLEEIIMRDNITEPVSLIDCRFDKYGGRITCDVLLHGMGGTSSVASEMLDRGLAIPYGGQHKSHDWCDPNLMSRTQIMACDS